MKDCERYELMISALLDGELDEREKAELSAHIVGCERCGALAAAFAAASGALSEGLEEPPAGLHGAIMEKLEAAAKVKRGQSRFMRLRPLVAAAACVAVVVVTLLAANHGIRMGSSAAAGDAETYAAAPEDPMYAAGGADGSAAMNGAAAGIGGAAPMEAPAPDPTKALAETAMDNDASEARGVMDDAATSEAALAEGMADLAEPESEADVPAGFPTLEVEAVAAGEEGSFTAEVLADPSGYFAPGTRLTVLSDEVLSPGARATVRYSGISFGAQPGAYYVTAEEIEISE